MQKNWAELGLGGIALVLVLITVIWAGANRSSQVAFAETQARLAKMQTVSNIDNSLIQLLAKTAAENHDLALRDLLSRNGVTFRDSASEPAPASPATPPAVPGQIQATAP